MVNNNAISNSMDMGIILTCRCPMSQSHILYINVES